VRHVAFISFVLNVLTVSEFAAGPTAFAPGFTFKGSSLNGWQPVGQGGMVGG
jgi:hypothetical protein